MSAPPRISLRIRKLRLYKTLGILARYLLRVCGLGLCLLCLYGALDAWQTLPEDSRLTLNVFLPAGLLVFAWAGLRRPGSLQDIAQTLDRYRADPRKSISCALDLERMQDQTALQSELRLAALEDAERSLQAAPLRALIPFGILFRLLVFALLAAGMTLTLTQRFPDASQTVWARIRDPHADIAPWTRLKFHLSPEDPSVLYGGDLQVALEVEGDMPDKPVRLLTRIDGEIRETPSYRESGQRYSQRLEQVTRPVEFAFALGRLQSEWKSVDLQLLPKIIRAEVTLVPPLYSGRPPRRYAFGSRSLKGLPGSEIELQVESNRPLSSGSLTLKREGQVSNILAGKVDGNRIHFTWELDSSAGLEIQLKDLLGNEMSLPLESYQQATPDVPPTVRLNSPESFLLATPNSVIRLQGSASDDVGVSRISLIRGMPGYIDRPKLIAEGAPQRQWTFEESLDLSALGVEPGQTLEFYLEAVDHRPDGGRTGVSPLSRVQIISEDAYAATLRQAEQLEGFQERFYMAADAMQKVREALEALQNEIDGNPTQESLKEALKNAAAASRQAEEVFRQQAEDFPIYDLEKKAQEKLENLRDHFGKQAETLENLDPNDMALDLKVAQITGAQKDKEAEVAQSNEEAERFLKIGRLLEQTVRYQQLVEQQALLVRWFERFAYALPEESREMLQTLGDYQLELEKETEAWIEETRIRAEALGEEDEKWKREVEEMFRILRQNRVQSLMQQASDAAINEKNREALRLAKAALEGMRRLKRDSQEGQQEANGFCEMCMGGSGDGQGSGLSDSLQQLLNALRSRGRGNGKGSGAGGGGIGGSQNDGYLTRGSSPLHLPMQGPQRKSPGNPSGEQIGGNGGSGGRSGDGSSAPAVSMGHQAGKADAPAEPVELLLEKSPPQYRSAIRNFFDLNPENQP